MLLKPHFVKTTDSISELLDSMRTHKIYLAIVKDEDGKVAGVVTIEDFLEELVGEIWDEEDEVDFDFYKLGGNRFNVSASLKTGEVFERMGIELRDKRLASYTVGVWVAEHFGRLPEKDESFVYENCRITIEKLTKTRVLSVVIQILDEEELEELEEEKKDKDQKEKDETVRRGGASAIGNADGGTGLTVREEVGTK